MKNENASDEMIPLFLKEQFFCKVLSHRDSGIKGKQNLHGDLVVGLFRQQKQGIPVSHRI